MKCSNSRSAFATVTAILLLGLVTASLAALMLVSRNDYLRAESSFAQAQLRQMMLAAIIDTNSRSNNWSPTQPPEQWTLDLPADQGSVRLELLTKTPTELQVRMTASLDKHHQMQLLRYAQTDSRWKLVEVNCNPG